MPVRFELPNEIEIRLRKSVQDLDQAAKEAALVELYRQDELTQYELSQSLGISRLETDALLKRHKVTEDLPTAGEIKEEVDNLRRLLDP